MIGPFENGGDQDYKRAEEMFEGRLGCLLEQ